MLSNSQKKYINSLKLKKFRNQHQAFIVEGEKMVHELIDSDFEIEAIYGTEKLSVPYFFEINSKELASISLLKTPNKYLAIARQKKEQQLNIKNELVIALDDIQDPGNMGTIIRTADWFGVKTIVCSMNCVDVYNPKVVQATMGSLFRVNVIYDNLTVFFEKNKNLKVYGALLDGENLYDQKIENQNAVLLMGNESKGLSEELKKYITHQVFIPRYGRAESLNVAVATAILCAESRKTD